MKRFIIILAILLCAGHAWGFGSRGISGSSYSVIQVSGANALKYVNSSGTTVKIQIWPDSNISDYGSETSVGSIAWAFSQVTGSSTQPVEIELMPGTYNVKTSITQGDYESLICNTAYGAILKYVPDSVIADYAFKVANYVTVDGIKFWVNDLARGVSVIAKTQWVIKNSWVKDVYYKSSAPAEMYHAWDVKGSTYGKFINCKGEGGSDDQFSVQANPAGDTDPANQSAYIDFINCDAWGGNHGGAVWESGFEFQDLTHDVSYIGCRAWDVETGFNNHSGSTSKYAYNITIKGCTANSVHFDYVYYSNIDLILVPGMNQTSISIAPSEPQFNYMKGCNINVVSHDANLKFQYVDNSIVKAVSLDGAIDWNYGDNSIVELTSLRRDAVSPTANLTADCLSTATTLSIADTSAWRIGQTIQVHDGNSTAESVKILSKTSTDITFTPAVSSDFTTAQTAHIQLPYWNAVALGGDPQYNIMHFVTSGFAGNMWSNGATGYFNNIIGSQKVNFKTCTGDITIYPHEGYLALIDPNGGDRAVTASGFTKGDTLVISNIDDAADPGNVLTFHGTTISKDQRYWFYYTGSVWNVVFFYDSSP